MAGVNYAVLIGNVGGDPEIRTTGSGTKVAGFSLATSETWKDRDSGEKKERTEWHRVVVFGPSGGGDGLVGVVERFVKKGSKLFVQGPLRTRDWEDQAGVKRYTTEIVLSGPGAQLQLLDRAGGRPPGPESEDAYAGGRSSGGGLRDEIDDEIPF